MLPLTINKIIKDNRIGMRWVHFSIKYFSPYSKYALVYIKIYFIDSGWEGLFQSETWLKIKNFSLDTSDLVRIFM